MFQLCLGQTIMVIYLDVDRFLTKYDIRALKSARWPWIETHFLLSRICYGCGHKVSTDSGQRPVHIVLKEEHIKLLLKEKKFWCDNCKIFSVYDHFISDECEQGN